MITPLTNELNIPSPIVNAIMRRDAEYDKGDCDFSTTELIGPPRIRYLRNKYKDKIVEDASDRIFALIGSNIHKILEESGEGYITEKRYFSEFGGVTVSGQIDVFHYGDHKLSDYKICSRHVITDGVKPDWQAQLSMNALLMRRNHIPVNSAEIIAILRDWTKMAAGRNKDYPRTQVQVLPVQLWSEVATEDYILDRIKAHSVEGLPEVCTSSERWRKPDQWALMKKGLKRAKKLYDEKDEAKAMAEWENQSHDPLKPFYVEPRPGEDIRCLNYCEVAPYCSYFQELMQEKL